MSELHRQHPIFQQLLGCHWGRWVATPDDQKPCPERAVQIVVLHNGPEEIEVRLCERHVEAVRQQTTPHVGPT